MVFSSFNIAFGNNDENIVQEDLNDEQIIKKAEELGMVNPEDVDTENEEALVSELKNKIEVLKNQKEKEIEKSQQLEAKINDMENDYKKLNEKISNLEKENEKLENQKTEVETVEKTEDENTNEVKYKTIWIPSGSSSERISRILYDNGLVDNTTKFNNYIKSRGLTRRLQPGSFKVPLNSTYSNVLNSITR